MNLTEQYVENRQPLYLYGFLVDVREDPDGINMMQDKMNELSRRSIWTAIFLTGQERKHYYISAERTVDLIDAVESICKAELDAIFLYANGIRMGIRGRDCPPCIIDIYAGRIYNHESRRAIVPHTKGK